MIAASDVVGSSAVSASSATVLPNPSTIKVPRAPSVRSAIQPDRIRKPAPPACDVANTAPASVYPRPSDSTRMMIRNVSTMAWIVVRQNATAMRRRNGGLANTARIAPQGETKPSRVRGSRSSSSVRRSGWSAVTASSASAMVAPSAPRQPIAMTSGGIRNPAMRPPSGAPLCFSENTKPRLRAGVTRASTCVPAGVFEP